jgi:hypothetical protein
LGLPMQRFLFILAISCACSAAHAPTPFTYDFIEKQLACGVLNTIEFKQIADTPVVYRVWGIWNFGHSAQDVALAAINFSGYPRIFRYVYRCDRLNDPAARGKLGTWYVEGRAVNARVWAIGDIDTLLWDSDSSTFKFIAHQNEDSRLEKQFNANKWGWLNYRTHGVRLAALVVANGPDSCRVGIIAQGWVRTPMPEWLITLGTNIVLPQLLCDLEDEVRKVIRERRKLEGPWYEQVIKFFGGMF